LHLTLKCKKKKKNLAGEQSVKHKIIFLSEWDWKTRSGRNRSDNRTLRVQRGMCSDSSPGFASAPLEAQARSQDRSRLEDILTNLR